MSNNITIAIAPPKLPIASLSGVRSRAVMEVVFLQSAKDLFFEIRGTRTLVQSLDRRKADQVEGGI
jgi:hypothetical protein